MKTNTVKLQFVVAIFLAIATTSFSQINYKSHYAIGGFLADQTHDIAYDGNNNIISVGFCQGLGTNAHAVTDTNSTATTFTNYGAKDGFVVKFNSNGSLAWALAIGSSVTTTNEEALAVETDDTGNVFIGGFFSGVSVFDGTNTANGSGLGNDAFLIKLDASGNSKWVKTFGFGGNQSINDIEIQSNGNIVIAGAIGDSISFGGANLTGSGGVDLFLATLDPSGNFVWQMQSTQGNNSNKVGQIELDDLGNIYFGGEINGNGFSGSSSFFGGYMAKVSASGNVIWDKSIAGGDNTIAALSLDGNGYLYLTGEHSAPLNLSSSISFTVSGSSDGFLVKYDTSGTLQNAIQLKSSGQDHVNGVFTPNSKDVIFTGSFEGFQVEFLDSSGALLNDAFQIGGEDFYISQTTDSFDFPSASVFGNGSTNADRTYAITGNSNQFTIGGSFNGTPFYLKNQSSGPSIPGQASTAFLGTYGFTPSVSGPSGPLPTPKYTITFEVDMQNETIGGGVSLNYLTKGNISKDTIMVNTTNDVFQVSLEVDSGFPIYYRFKNGSNLESVPFQCNTYDSLSNITRIQSAFKNDTLPLVCFSSCSACIPAPVCNVGPAGQITGATNYCLGDQEVAFEVSPITGATSYVWFILSGNQVIAGGQGTNKVKVNMNDAGAAVLAVYGTDGTCNGDTATLNLSAPSPAVTFTINENTSPKCGEATGQLEVTNLSGGSTYDFQWTTGETSSLLDSISGGVYEVTITSNTGCSASGAYSLASTGAPSISSNVTPPTCHNYQDGEIDLTITGGTSPYNVKWLTGQTTEDLNNISPGGYYVEVIDDSGCVAFECVQVPNPSKIEITGSSSNPTSCGASDGSFTMSVLGGTGTLSYLWSTSATSQNLSGLGAGAYSFRAEDANGCQQNVFMTLSDQGGPEILVNKITPTTCNNNIGSVEVSINNAVDPLIVWSSGDSTQNIYNLSGGRYNLTVTDSNCTAVAGVTIFERRPFPTEICMVTVDDTTGNNLLIFDKTASDSITTKFNIYRESCLTNQFLHIGSVSKADQSEFEDVNSNPSVKSWKYKITAVDACENESFASSLHKTIHATVLGDTINGTDVSWNPYVGFNYDWFFVERFNTQSGWVVLDSVPNNQLTYFDANPQGTTKDIMYSVFVKHPEGCTSYEANKNYNSARSNRSAPPYDTTKINNPVDTTDTTISVININAISNKISVYPNPANNFLIVQMDGDFQSNGLFELVDLNGKILRVNQVNSNSNATINFDLHNLTNGLYILKYTSSEGVFREQFLITR